MVQFSRHTVYLFALHLFGGLPALALPQGSSNVTLKRRDDLASPESIILDTKPIRPLLSRTSPAASSLNPAQLLPRGVYTANACEIRNSANCQYGQTEAHCLGPGYQSWIVGCAGCKPNHNELGTPVVGDCPKDRFCVEFRNQNDFGQAANDIECVPEQNFVSWANKGKVASSTGKFCSPGLQNVSKENYKVNAYLTVYDQNLQYNVNAGALYIVINGGSTDSATNDYLLSDSLILPPGGSVQGCFSLQPDTDQLLRATLGLAITT